MNKNLDTYDCMPDEFEYAELTKIAPPNMRRHYEIHLKKTSAGWEVLTVWGRIGGWRKQKTETAETFAEAQKLGGGHLRKRIRHGYTITAITSFPDIAA